MKILYLLTAATFFLSDKALAQEQMAPKGVTVCDLLAHPSEYNRRRITVRGEYVAGGHGLFLQGVGCDSVLITDGYRWPPMLSIPFREDEIRSRGFSFEKLQGILTEVGAVIAREFTRKSKDSKAPIIMITVTGLFETHDNFAAQVARRPNGEFMVNGFGPMAAAPGQLFLESLKEVAVQFEDDFKR